MNIEYRETNPDKKGYFDLFQTTGWNEEYHFTPDELERALVSSWCAVSAFHDSKLVGYGRAIADGIHHALIVDMIVRPDYQGQGIGGTILEKIIQKCRAHKIRDVQLFCAKGKVGFYEKFGFVSRPADAPGMELKRERESQ